MVPARHVHVRRDEEQWYQEQSAVYQRLCKYPAGYVRDAEQGQEQDPSLDKAYIQDTYSASASSVLQCGIPESTCFCLARPLRKGVED